MARPQCAMRCPRTLLSPRVTRVPGRGALRDPFSGPRAARGSVPNLLPRTISMALFGRTQDAIPAPGMPEGGIAREEVAMGERERIVSQPTGPGSVDAFLGKGTRVTGKLVFEGTGRIEGQVEGEISARDTLTIGEGGVVNASVSGAAIIIEGRVTGDVTAQLRVE